MRPLSLGEILDVAIKIYLRNWATLFRIVVVVIAPVQLITMVVFASALPQSLLTPPDPTSLDPSSQLDADFEPSDVYALAGGTAVVIILSLLATTIATAACYKAITDAYLGTEPAWRESLRFATRKLPPVLWVTFLSGFLALLGLIACIAPGVWLYVSWAVAVPALLTENERGTNALRRSFRLVRNRWWRTFGVLVVAYLLTSIITNVISALFTAISFTPAGSNFFVIVVSNTISGTVAAVISTPFTAAVITLVYFDLRVRKEGFDLQLLASRVGVTPAGGAGSLPPPPAPPPPHPAAQTPPFWPPPPGWQPSPAADADTLREPPARPEPGRE